MKSAVSGKFSLRATLGADAGMALFVNGAKAAEGQAPGLIPRQPKDELSIGQDDLSAVGEYAAPNALNGKVTNVRVTTP